MALLAVASPYKASSMASHSNVMAPASLVTEQWLVQLACASAACIDMNAGGAWRRDNISAGARLATTRCRAALHLTTYLRLHRV